MLIDTIARDVKITTSAIYSNCERYRYFLSRTWNEDNPVIMFIMMNPSKATEVKNDNTVKLCMNRALADEFGALWVLNLFAYYETSPKELRRVTRDEGVRPIGQYNDVIISQKVDAIIARQNEGNKIVCAWGGDGSFNGRGLAVKQTLKNRLNETNMRLYHLGKTGPHPKHPLHTLNKVGENRIEFQQWND